MRLLLISMLIFSVSAFTQEESSREPAPGVTELTVIKVKANYLGDYMDGIEPHWDKIRTLVLESANLFPYSPTYHQLHFADHLNFDWN